MAVTFSTVLKGGSGNTVGIEVPADAIAQLGPARKYPVVVTIGGYAFRNTVSWYQGAFMIGLSGEHRSATGLGAGDEVEVTLEIDDQPRVLELPDDFTAALDAAGKLDAFRALSFSRQRGLFEPWQKAKAQDTKDRNLQKILAAL